MGFTLPVRRDNSHGRLPRKKAAGRLIGVGGDHEKMRTVESDTTRLDCGESPRRELRWRSSWSREGGGSRKVSGCIIYSSNIFR